MACSILILSSMVFVHGLMGDPYLTWSCTEPENNWPKCLLSQNIPDARILTFGYDARIADLSDEVSTNTIRDHANNLLIGLTHERERNNLVFAPAALEKATLTYC